MKQEYPTSLKSTGNSKALAAILSVYMAFIATVEEEEEKVKVEMEVQDESNKENLFEKPDDQDDIQVA